MTLPLDGIVVLEFAQYMAGPWAGLRLSDLGARVIKVERPGVGEAGRALATKNMRVDGDSLVFHTANRGKESFAANLKDPDALEEIRRLIASADVLTHNFRPGVMERIGLGPDAVAELNPRLIYATVTGYGTDGPWRDKPGQDLLAQSASGLAFLSGTDADAPVPFGLAVSDAICGAHLAQGILAALVRRGKTGRGGHVEVNLLESSLDLQFEGLTTFLNDGRQLPMRAGVAGAHPYQGAPYGVYATADGYLALAMGTLSALAEALSLTGLEVFGEPGDTFDRGDEIRTIIGSHVSTHPTQYWLDLLEPRGVWCAKVMTYDELRAEPGYQALQIEQTVSREGAPAVRTLRCPIRIDGARLYATEAAPRVGAHTDLIREEMQSA
nr:CoA transferase [Microbacterium barkeri]